VIFCIYIQTQNIVTLSRVVVEQHTHTHPFNGPFCGTTRVSRYQKGKPIWILLKQETVSSSGISWAICKSAPRSRQVTMPAPHHSFFYRPDALPAAQPTASKHWRHSEAIRFLKKRNVFSFFACSESKKENTFLFFKNLIALGFLTVIKLLHHNHLVLNWR